MILPSAPSTVVKGQHGLPLDWLRPFSSESAVRFAALGDTLFPATSLSSSLASDFSGTVGTSGGTSTSPNYFPFSYLSYQTTTSIPLSSLSSGQDASTATTGQVICSAAGILFAVAASGRVKNTNCGVVKVHCPWRTSRLRWYNANYRQPGDNVRRQPIRQPVCKSQLGSP